MRMKMKKIQINRREHIHPKGFTFSVRTGGGKFYLCYKLKEMKEKECSLVGEADKELTGGEK